jgi:prepilin-type N-terminal cleavage/methylation domain-containing protein
LSIKSGPPGVVFDEHKRYNPIMTVRTEGGFTLIELVVTMVVLSTIFLSIFGLFDTLHGINARANNLATATQVAQREMELIRNQPYNQITTGTKNVTADLSPYPSLGASRSAAVVVSQADSRGLKQVDITIRYYDGAIARRVDVSTLVAQNGIDK